MPNAVLYHKPDSIYDDDPAVRYHFPKSYLSRLQKAVNDWIIYDGPVTGRKGRYYTGLGYLKRIRPDSVRHGFYYADIENYLNFDQPVSCAQNGGFEPGFINEKGEINPGYRVQSVRVIDGATFVKILEAGLSDDEDWPDRVDPPQSMDTVLYASDNAQAPLFDAPGERPIIAQILNRPFRDKKFRQQIRKLYDRTCAFTGLRLINGKGRPEVEACHIKPVEDGGNDSVQNGIALSGTVHWMFDRGLLSLSDHYDILISRHLNYDVSHLLNKNLKAKVPTNPEHRPHPHYLAYHRDTKFKL